MYVSELALGHKFGGIVYILLLSTETYCTETVQVTLLVGRQEGHLACKKWGDGGGGHWLVRLDRL